MKITLYGKKGDAYTSAFKNFLKTSNVNFDFQDVYNNENAKIHTIKLYDGEIKYPTLFVDETIYLTPSSDTFNRVMKELKLRG